MKKVLTILLSFSLLFSLCACSNKKIVGTWTNSDINTTYVFNDDNTGSFTIYGIGVTFNWSVDGSTLTITNSLLGIVKTSTYTYSIDGDVLSLTEGSVTGTYTRVK